MSAPHDCVERINALLAEHNTRLSWAIGVIGSEGELIQLATCKADEKKRGRPVLMFASHCPFCGKVLSNRAACEASAGAQPSDKPECAKTALPEIEAELRKLPDLDEDDIDALLAMCKAGIEYAPELRRRKALRGMVPVCKYTGTACAYEAGECTCMLPGFVGDLPTEWVEPVVGPLSGARSDRTSMPLPAAALPVSAPAGVRMLTEDEVRNAHPQYTLHDRRGLFAAIQRKFCSVNGLKLAAMSATTKEN